MKAIKSKEKIGNARRSPLAMLASAFFGLYACAGAAMAQGDGYGQAESKVTGFLTNINGLLNVASIAVVTIAIIFAGYQIAFAHKRIADVAPILIGGLLIGAAAQIARMLIGDPNAPTTMLQALPIFYA